MIIQMTLKEGGEWWRVDIYNIDNLKLILNTGYWREQRIYAVMLSLTNGVMIYDFSISQWR